MRETRSAGSLPPAGRREGYTDEADRWAAATLTGARRVPWRFSHDLPSVLSAGLGLCPEHAAHGARMRAERRHGWSHHRRPVLLPRRWAVEAVSDHGRLWCGCGGGREAIPVAFATRCAPAVGRRCTRLLVHDGSAKGQSKPARQQWVIAAISALRSWTGVARPVGFSRSQGSTTLLAPGRRRLPGVPFALPGQHINVVADSATRQGVARPASE